MQLTIVKNTKSEKSNKTDKTDKTDITILLEENLDLADVVERLVDQGLSLRRLSELSGKSRTVWDGLLHRKTAMPTLDTLQALAGLINELADNGDPIYVGRDSVPFRTDEWQLMKLHELTRDKRPPIPAESQIFKLETALSHLPPDQWDQIIDSTLLLWEKWGTELKSLVALPRLSPEKLYQQVARDYEMNGQGVRNLATLVTQNLAERQLTLADLLEEEDDLDDLMREQLQQALAKLLWQGTLEPETHQVLLMFLARSLNDSSGNSFNGDIDALLSYCQMI